jgi:hypothetical protein
MINRLPRFAETKLQNLCAEAGALCHEVTEDESGWDYLVEFPPKPHAGPAESAPPNAASYVQVKSTETAQMSCRIKLSNALRAAQSPQPWFIVFMKAHKKTHGVTIYAIHFWEDLIRRTLEAVRKAEVKGTPLNRATLPIRFGAGDNKTNNLISWMQQSIDAVKPEYDEVKRSLFKTVGFESGYGEGTLTVQASNEEEIIKNFLGLGEGLRVQHFSFTPSRFGIPASAPEVEATEGTVVITPSHVGDVEVRVRSHASAHPIVMPGKAYVLNIPGMDDGFKRLRFSAAFLDLIWKIGGATDFSIRFDHNLKHDLVTLENYTTMNEWLTRGAIDVQVWRDGMRAFAGALQVDPAKLWPNWKIAASASRLLRAVAGPSSGVTVSLRELSKASGSQTFAEIWDTPSFRVEFNHTPDVPSALTSVVYWFHLHVGEHAFYALVLRAVREDVVVGGKRVITAGQGRLLENFVLTRPNAEDRAMMKSDYERHLARLEASETPIGFGDLRDFITRSAAERLTKQVIE